MRSLALALVLVVLGGCAAGTPRYERRQPKALAPAATPRLSSDVRIELRRNPWWTVAGTRDAFILGLPAPDTPPTRTPALGDVRSADIGIGEVQLDRLRCAWMIVPVGEGRPCREPRDEAIAGVAPLVDQALADLRARGAAAGAPVIAGVRCFAVRARLSRLWCEGTALAAERRGGLVFDEAPRADRPHADTLPSTRLVLIADLHGGLLGGSGFTGTSFGLRYRPIELTMGYGQQFSGSFVLGATAAARIRLGDSRADVLAGVNLLAVAHPAPEGASDRAGTIDGMYGAFAGLGYQARRNWFFNLAQPYVSIRLGAVRGDPSGGDARGAPMAELRLGLSSPER